MRTDIRFTYEEYRALPETGPRYQLVDGDLLMSPAPTFRHQDVSQRINLQLAMYVAIHRLGKVLYAPLDVILSDEDVFQPDIVFVSNARQAIIAPEGLRGAPDLCVEILSPTTRELDTKVKRLAYAKFGLPELWIVDPDANWLQVFRLQEDPRRTRRTLSERDTLSTELLPGFALDLSCVFAK